MKEQFAEILKRHEKEIESLAGVRFVDIEKLQQMGRPFAEIKEVHDRYQKEQQNMAVRHGKEKAAFFKVQERSVTDRAVDMINKYDRKREQRDQERGPGGHER